MQTEKKKRERIGREWGSLSFWGDLKSKVNKDFSSAFYLTFVYLTHFLFVPLPSLLCVQLIHSSCKELQNSHINLAKRHYVRLFTTHAIGFGVVVAAKPIRKHTKTKKRL